MNEIIKQFIQRQNCATICCADEKNKPHCFSCFYIFNPEEGLLYFKSSDDSYHSEAIKSNPVIAGTILPDKLNKLIIRGAQLEGNIVEELHPLAKDAFTIYHKKVPMALAIKGKVYTVRLNAVKMTDSHFGFGKKITWNRSETEIVT